MAQRKSRGAPWKAMHGLRPEDLAAIGITNQRETTSVWNRKTGNPVRNPIVWQDTRVADYVDELSRCNCLPFAAKESLTLVCLDVTLPTVR